MRKILIACVLLICFAFPACAGELTSFQSYSGRMPYEFDDLRASEGMMRMTFFDADPDQLHAYLEQFRDEGWGLIKGEDDQSGWEVWYAITAGENDWFCVAFDSGSRAAVFVFYDGMELGFDPTERL